MKAIVVTAPDHDLVTSTFAKSIKRLLREVDQGFEVTILAGADVTAQNFITTVEAKNPDLILLNGHGSPDALYGQNDELLISTAHKDLDKLKGRIIHALACDAAVALGPKLISIGTKSFLGYNEPFGFCISRDPQGGYVDNGLPDLFIEPANEVISSLIKGSSVKNSYEVSQASYRKNIQTVYASQDSWISQDRAVILAFLLRNYRSQCYLGNAEARL